MTHSRTILAAAAALAVTATAAHAQDTAQAAPRVNSISIGLGSTPTIGFWHRLSPRAELGVEVGARYVNAGLDDSDQDSHASDITVGPALKLYGRADGPVRPYTYAQVSAGYASGTSTSIDPLGGAFEIKSHEWDFGAGVGLGLEWFPIERVSLGGHAGILGQWVRSTIENPTGPDSKAHGAVLSTFTSGLRAQLYF